MEAKVLKLEAVAEKGEESVFNAWLNLNPNACVIKSSPYSLAAVASVAATAAAAAPSHKETAETETREEKVDDEYKRLALERNQRLLPYTSWNLKNAPKIGMAPIKVNAETKSAHLQGLKSAIFHMEDCKEDTDLARFIKFNTDGYLLLRNVLRGSNEEEGKILERAQSDMVDFIAATYVNADYDKKSFEKQFKTREQLNMETTRASSKSKKKKGDVSETLALTPDDDDDEEDEPKSEQERAVLESGNALLQSARVQAVVESLCRGASQYHKQELAVKHRSSWARMRGGTTLAPRKEWTEFYFFRTHEPSEEEQSKWNRRYAREITRRKENPKPRYAFNVWVSITPNGPNEGGSCALAVCPGSHQFAGFLHQTRESDEVPMDFRQQSQGLPWVVEELNPGDVLLVDMQTARAYVQNNKTKPAPMLGLVLDSMYTMGESSVKPT